MYEKLGQVSAGSRWSDISRMMIEMKRMKIRCHCGREIVCHNHTNACHCGRDYNMSGTLLAPREQWGEETGETVSDILMADVDARDDWRY